MTEFHATKAPCCFCGRDALLRTALALVVYQTVQSTKPNQTLHAHPECLRTHVEPGTPLVLTR